MTKPDEENFEEALAQAYRAWSISEVCRYCLLSPLDLG